MSNFYFDTSALVKRYIAEKGTAWVNSLFGNNHIFYAASVTAVEMVAALRRRLQFADHPQIVQFESEFDNGFHRVDMTEALLTHARRLAKQYGLRGYDAIQLAASLRVFVGAPALIFMCADNELIAAAQNEGMQVDNPNNH